MYCANLACFAFAAVGKFCAVHGPDVYMLYVHAKSPISIWLIAPTCSHETLIMSCDSIKCTLRDDDDGHSLLIEDQLPTEKTKLQFHRFPTCSFRFVKTTGPATVNFFGPTLIDPEFCVVNAANGADIIFPREPMLLERCNAILGRNCKLDMGNCNVANVRLFMTLNAQLSNFVVGKDLHATMHGSSVLRGKTFTQCQKRIDANPDCHVHVDNTGLRSDCWE